MVTSKSSGHGASKSSQNPRAQNFKGSPKNFAQNQDLKVMAQKDEKLQFTHGADVQPLSSPKEAKLSLPKAKDVEKAIDQSNGEGDENDSFHRLYNKEIKVNQDEIPLLLLELTDIAFKFIKKDQFEKAYVLLQKTESVLEVVNLDHSKRDRYFAYITYLNMAMCFQKLGMLEECIIYLKETIQVIEKPNFFKDVSISQRMKQMHMQCQLKLQLCAILSQTQKHTEAMDHAKASVRLAHQILRDLYDLCVFYSNKIKFKDDFASLSLLLMEETEDGNEDL
jgi:tetratricopeptide (TPR) repeat protein